MKKDKEKTKVIFRYWFPVDDEVFPWTPKSWAWGNKRMGDKARKQDYGEVIAIFPEIPADNECYKCQSFIHIGQHGGADYHGVLTTSVPATPDDYKDLKKELEENYGYNLQICHKFTQKMHDARRKNLEQM